MPNEDEKIIIENSDLIQLVINSVNFENYIPALNNNLTLAEENGWVALVSAIKKILSGERDMNGFLGLDHEDQVIVSKIISIIDSPEDMTKILLQEAVQQYNKSNVAESELICRKACELSPGSPDANAQLGFVLQSQKKYEESKLYYKKSLSLNPTQPVIYLNLGVILQEEKDFDAACVEFQRALDIDQNLIQAIEHLSYLHEKSYRLAEAQSLVDRGLKIDADSKALNLVQSKLLQRKGKFEDAVKFLHVASESNKIPSLSSEIYSRLGYLYDRLGETGKAYHYYSIGNQFSEKQFSQQNVNKEQYIRQVDYIAELAGKVEPEQLNKSPENNVENTPVFLVGFPRSGTTLMNQILDSHPGLQVLEEKPQVFNMLMKFQEFTDGQLNPLADISQENIDNLRNVYFDTVKKYIELDSDSLFIDKFPLNIAYIPIIWRVFPEAKFILALRHPCDAILSCFMHSFGVNPAMANFLTMEDTVNLYIKLMSNWELFLRKFNLNVHVIKYENLIEDFQKETEETLNFLELEWDDEVASHTDKARARGFIDTPSYDQVTEPIYNHAKYRWLRYGEQLKPYVSAVEPYINIFGYES